MEKGTVKLVVFNGEDLGYCKNRSRNYLLNQGRAIWEIIQEAYVIPAILDNATQCDLQRCEERNPQVERESFYFYVMWPCYSLG
jgi:hypothetical protein